MVTARPAVGRDGLREYTVSITQQYALDLFRASQHGVTPPPAPGTTRGPGLLRGAARALRARRGRRTRRTTSRPAKPAGCATC